MIIRITDGIGHLSETITLAADGTLSGTGWVVDTLARNGLAISSEMADDEIEEVVYDAFSGAGYAGDPEENGLTVRVVG